MKKSIKNTLKIMTEVENIKRIVRENYHKLRGEESVILKELDEYHKLFDNEFGIDCYREDGSIQVVNEPDKNFDNNSLEKPPRFILNFNKDIEPNFISPETYHYWIMNGVFLSILEGKYRFRIRKNNHKTLDYDLIDFIKSNELEISHDPLEWSDEDFILLKLCIE